MLFRSDTNIKYLVDNDCHIWDGDAYKNYGKNNSTSRKYLGSRCSLCGKISNHDTDYPNENDTNCIHCGKEDRWEHLYEDENILTQEEFINKIKTDDEFAKKWGELGPIYGKQWRSWKIGDQKLKWSQLSEEEKLNIDKETIESTHPDVAFYTKEKHIDQIANLISELKTNPDSRRLMVNAWNVGELDQMVLPPCHYGFQVYTRELTWEEQVQWVMRNTDVELENVYIVEEIAKPTTPKRAISLLWNQRSVDVFLGLPFNIASYGLLLEMIAREVNMVPEHLIGHLGDTHLYSNHIEQAKEQIDREPKELPVLKMSSGHNFRAALAGKADEIDLNDFILIGYDPHPAIKAPLSN